MSFRARLTARTEVLAGTFLNLDSPLAAEIVALAGFDWIAIDLEHGASDERSTLQHLQAISHTATAGLVRVESLDRSRIAHALDAGATGVIVPQIRSAAEAAEAVSHCRYSSGRGVARFNRAWQWGARQGALADADDEVICCVQIERSDALEDVESIAQIDGVDILFVGPADLGHALGANGGADDPVLLAAAERVANATARHEKSAGVLCGSMSQLEHYSRLGFTFLGCSADSALLMEHSRQVAAKIKLLQRSG